MPRIALVTSAELADLTPDDQFLARELMKRNYNVLPIVWDNPATDWQSFDLIIIRSPWDYVAKISNFIRWLDYLEKNKIIVWNNIEIIRNNIDKIYLKNLQDKGVRIIPSVWLEKGAKVNFTDIIEKANWQKVVIKPAISATAYNTFLVDHLNAQNHQENLELMLLKSGVIIQKFMPEISENGEWSFIFFRGNYSHAVLKRTAENDFRVQEKFGGYIEHTKPPEHLVKEVKEIVGLAAPDCLFARVDGIEAAGVFLLMELELIEPALFLENDPSAPGRFADAINVLL